MTVVASEARHAALMVVRQCGVLITGPAGIGKTELCLSLLDRGHRLVCDDMVMLYMIEDQLMGKAVDPLHTKLAIRDIGLMDVESTYGSQAICATYAICTHVQLSDKKPCVDPLQVQPSATVLLGMAIPCYIIGGVKTDRPLALMIEQLSQKHIVSY